MTLTADPDTTRRTAEPASAPPHARDATVNEERAGRERPRTSSLIALWAVVAVVAVVSVLYLLEPVFQQRTQRSLFDDYRAKVDNAANESFGLAGVSVPKKAPELGAPVGIMEVGDLGLQVVVVEGAAPSQTQAGPGHVPGTAGLGQPGNSVVVGRRGTFGAPFADLSGIRSGARILVTTTQGQSVYQVDSVERKTLTTAPPPDEGLVLPSSSGADEGAGPSDGTVDGKLPIDTLLGASKDDRLTLVTSSSSSPVNDSQAIVVTAKLQGTAYAPTPQNGRTDAQTGVGTDPSAWAPLVLALLFLGLSIGVAVFLYQSLRPATVYLLTIGPLLVFAILAAETLSRLLPAWM